MGAWFEDAHCAEPSCDPVGLHFDVFREGQCFRRLHQMRTATKLELDLPTINPLHVTQEQETAQSWNHSSPCLDWDGRARQRDYRFGHLHRSGDADCGWENPNGRQQPALFKSYVLASKE